MKGNESRSKARLERENILSFLIFNVSQRKSLRDKKKDLKQHKQQTYKGQNAESRLRRRKAEIWMKGFDCAFEQRMYGINKRPRSRKSVIVKSAIARREFGIVYSA